VTGPTGATGPAAVGFTDGDKGDITISSTGTVLTIDNDAVTYAKLQNVSATDRLLGRSSAGSGDVEEITCTAFGRSLIDDADAASARTTLSVQPTASPAFTGAATFDNTGNVVPLTITNTGTANSFVVNDASGDASPFVIDASGRVGIGTSSPGAELEVADSSSDNDVRINLRANSTALSQVGASSTQMFVDSGGARPFAVYTSSTLRFTVGSDGVSTFSGQLLVTAGSASACGVAFSGDGNTGLAQIGGADTASLVTAGVERVRVGSGGGVGIGTTTTTDALNVVGITSHYQSANGTPALGSKTYYSACFENFSAGYGLALGGVQGGNGAAYLQVQSFSSAVAYPMYLQALGGEVLIGTTTDNGAYLLQVNSQIYATNATIATSDARFKTNVESLTDATAVIEALRPVAFDFLPHAERNFATERQVGLIAQEAQAALAGCDYADSVVAQCGDHLGLAYEKLVPVLIRALQESNARIAALEERINA